MEEHVKELIKKIANVEDAIKTVFDKSIFLATRKVGVGGTSGTVYVPKKYKGKMVTVVIWPYDNKGKL